MKHNRLITCTLSLLLLAGQSGMVLAQTEQYGLITTLEGSDSKQRVLYMDGEAYTLARGIKVTSESGGIYDPLLLRAGQPMEIQWTMVKGVKTITAIKLLEAIPQ